LLFGAISPSYIPAAPNVDHARVEVNVLITEATQLAEPQAGVERCGAGRRDY
jgi:hypothetical protein